ncbi:hypothetical protein HPG69_010004 [Diceros bicornis minor]|uniref:Uncharacterized protein n=1 Tax=Diceros bicornis minor TaxID=77932 RepID=A0A7J7EQC4_DICBM|nr:hypothetical protein HPG69_010004 [Diceros bicornis minor]
MLLGKEKDVKILSKAPKKAWGRAQLPRNTWFNLASLQKQASMSWGPSPIAFINPRPSFPQAGTKPCFECHLSAGFGPASAYLEEIEESWDKQEELGNRHDEEKEEEGWVWLGSWTVKSEEKGAGSANKALSEDSCSSGRRTEAPIAKGSGVLLQKEGHLEGVRSTKKAGKRKQGVHLRAARETGGNAEPFPRLEASQQDYSKRWRQPNRDVDPGQRQSELAQVTYHKYQFSIVNQEMKEKANVVEVSLADNSEYKIYASNVPMPEDKYTVQVDAEEKEDMKSCAEFSLSKARIDEYEKELEKIKNIIPFDQMTIEDLNEVFPDNQIRQEWGHHFHPLGDELGQAGAEQGRPHGHGHHQHQGQGSRHDSWGGREGREGKARRKSLATSAPPSVVPRASAPRCCARSCQTRDYHSQGALRRDPAGRRKARRLKLVAKDWATSPTIAAEKGRVENSKEGDNKGTIKVISLLRSQRFQTIDFSPEDNKLYKNSNNNNSTNGDYRWIEYNHSRQRSEADLPPSERRIHVMPFVPPAFPSDTLAQKEAPGLLLASFQRVSPVTFHPHGSLSPVFWAENQSRLTIGLYFQRALSIPFSGKKASEKPIRLDAKELKSFEGPCRRKIKSGKSINHLDIEQRGNLEPNQLFYTPECSSGTRKEGCRSPFKPAQLRKNEVGKQRMCWGGDEREKRGRARRKVVGRMEVQGRGVELRSGPAAAAQTQSPAGERSSRQRPARSPAASPPSPRDAPRPVISRRPWDAPPHNYLSATAPTAPPSPPGESGAAPARGLPAPRDTPRAPCSRVFVCFCRRPPRLHSGLPIGCRTPVDHDVSLFAYDIETSPRPAPPPPPPPRSGRLSSSDPVGAGSGLGRWVRDAEKQRDPRGLGSLLG